MINAYRHCQPVDIVNLSTTFEKECQRYLFTTTYCIAIRFSSKCSRILLIDMIRQ